MPMLKVVLQPTEKKALQTLASRELRDPRDQALLIIRDELERRGLLPADDRTAETLEAQHAGD